MNRYEKIVRNNEKCLIWLGNKSSFFQHRNLCAGYGSKSNKMFINFSENIGKYQRIEIRSHPIRFHNNPL